MNFKYFLKWSQYKFSIHPILKIIVFSVINFLNFFQKLEKYRIYILFLEIIIAVLIHLDFLKILPFLKFLFVIFIPTYFMFFLIDFNWINALIYFGEYILTTFNLFFSIFIFNEITPLNELLICFKLLFIPKKIALGLTIAITFLPYLINYVKITKAIQESRGYKFRFWNIKPIIIPSIVSIMELSINLSISLNVRGIDV